MKENGWSATIKTQANFVPIHPSKKGPRKTAGRKRLITVSDAVATTWMILRGLGYTPEENEELVRTVEEVFATAATVDEEKKPDE